MYGSEGTAPHIIIYSTTTGKFSIASNGQFTFEETAPDTKNIGRWVDPICGLDTAELKNLSCQESSAFYPMAQSLYPLVSGRLRSFTFDVFKEVNSKSSWDVTPCKLCREYLCSI
jgi:hypothetical protein